MDTLLLVLVKVELRQPRKKDQGRKVRQCFGGAPGTPSLQEVLYTSTDPQTLGGLTIRLHCRHKVTSAFMSFTKSESWGLGAARSPAHSLSLCSLREGFQKVTAPELRSPGVGDGNTVVVWGRLRRAKSPC